MSWPGHRSEYQIVNCNCKYHSKKKLNEHLTKKKKLKEGHYCWGWIGMNLWPRWRLWDGWRTNSGHLRAGRWPRDGHGWVALSPAHCTDCTLSIGLAWRLVSWPSRRISPCPPTCRSHSLCTVLERVSHATTPEIRSAVQNRYGPIRHCYIVIVIYGITYVSKLGVDHRGGR